MITAATRGIFAKGIHLLSRISIENKRGGNPTKNKKNSKNNRVGSSIRGGENKVGNSMNNRSEGYESVSSILFSSTHNVWTDGGKSMRKKEDILI